MITLRQDQYVKKGLAEDMVDDAQLCIDLRNLLNEQHITAGWFSKGYDITHLNTRLVANGETKLLDSKLHIDCIWYYKGWRGLKPMSSAMKNVAKFLKDAGVKGMEEKPEVPAAVWQKARVGNKKAMDQVCSRCEADVRITRAITEFTADIGMLKNIQRYP